MGQRFRDYGARTSFGQQYRVLFGLVWRMLSNALGSVTHFGLDNTERTEISDTEKFLKRYSRSLSFHSFPKTNQAMSGS